MLMCHPGGYLCNLCKLQVGSYPRQMQNYWKNSQKMSRGKKQWPKPVKLLFWGLFCCCPSSVPVANFIDNNAPKNLINIPSVT